MIKGVRVQSLLFWRNKGLLHRREKKVFRSEEKSATTTKKTEHERAGCFMVYKVIQYRKHNVHKVHGRQ